VLAHAAQTKHLKFNICTMSLFTHFQYIISERFTLCLPVRSSLARTTFSICLAQGLQTSQCE